MNEEFGASMPDDADATDWNFPCSPEDAIRAMDQLPQGYKMVFNLYALEHYSHKEIADTLGISEGTSKSQYARARRFLQNILISQKITS